MWDSTPLGKVAAQCGGIGYTSVKPRTESEGLFFCTARIANTKPNGESQFGTGFFYSAEATNGHVLVSLVTNKHVIEDYQRLKVFMLKSVDGALDVPHVGEQCRLEINRGDGRVWVDHPDPAVDITMLPFMPLLDSPDWIGGRPYFVNNPRRWTLWRADYEEEIPAMESVEFIGYPEGLYDSVNCLPIARRGMMATLGYIDYEGKPEFLIDATVLTGSSGSPVFMASHGMHVTAQGQITMGSRTRLIGVIAKTLLSPNLELDQPGGPNHFRDLGLVIKARCVDETMQHVARLGGLTLVEEFDLGRIPDVSTPR